MVEFADGSNDDALDADELFDAVKQFGPGSARVTRNAESNSIGIDRSVSAEPTAAPE